MFFIEIIKIAILFCEKKCCSWRYYTQSESSLHKVHIIKSLLTDFSGTVFTVLSFRHHSESRFLLGTLNETILF